MRRELLIERVKVELVVKKMTRLLQLLKDEPCGPIRREIIKEVKKVLLESN